MKERASAALANLQRNAYALGILRSRVESRINLVLSNGGRADSDELTKVLELVKNGELILKEMSEKIESARFLEEFIHIINGAADSVSEIREDVQELVPMAEAALAEMHDAISQVSIFMAPASKDEIDPSIFAQIEEFGKLASLPQVAMANEMKVISSGQSGEAPKEEMTTEEVAV